MNFTYLFYQHIMFRKSCGKCHFCNTTRPSDITLADFWGWEKSVPDFNKDDKGCSLVFINTEKGRLLWEQIENDLSSVPVELEQCLQPQLIHPAKIHPLRNEFEFVYKHFGFVAVSKIFGMTGLSYQIKQLIKKLLKK